MKTVCMFHCMVREISISNVLIITSTRFFFYCVSVKNVSIF